jgi:hypothetical protein
VWATYFLVKVQKKVWIIATTVTGTVALPDVLIYPYEK